MVARRPSWPALSVSISQSWMAPPVEQASGRASTSTQVGPGPYAFDKSAHVRSCCLQPSKALLDPERVSVSGMKHAPRWAFNLASFTATPGRQRQVYGREPWAICHLPLSQAPPRYAGSCPRPQQALPSPALQPLFHHTHRISVEFCRHFRLQLLELLMIVQLCLLACHPALAAHGTQLAAFPAGYQPSKPPALDPPRFPTTYSSYQVWRAPISHTRGASRYEEVCRYRPPTLLLPISGGRQPTQSVARTHAAPASARTVAPAAFCGHRRRLCAGRRPGSRRLSTTHTPVK